MTNENADWLNQLRISLPDDKYQMLVKNFYNLIQERDSLKAKVDKLEYALKKKFGVNDQCPCGSGRKFKKCCKDKSPEQLMRMIEKAAAN